MVFNFIPSYLIRTSEPLQQLLDSGMYEGIVLKGATPAMKYAVDILQGFCDAIKQRFQIESKNVINATKILNFESWPLPGTPEIKGLFCYSSKFPPFWSLKSVNSILK